MSATTLGRASRGRWVRLRDSDVLHSFLHSPTAIVSALIVLVFVICAAFAPWIAPHDPFNVATLSLLDSFKPPVPATGSEWSYVLGTDSQGRDMLSAIMFGTRLSLIVGLSAVVFAVVLGVAIGLLAGYAGGITDVLLMRAADIQLTFPSLLLALIIAGVIAAVLPADIRAQAEMYVVIFAIGISRWPQFARTVRGSTMVERNKDYVAAARVIGLSRARIMTSHILPNVMGPVWVVGTLTLGLAILDEATLSFLGIGLPTTQPSLGTLIRIGDDFLYSGQWWVTIFPGLALVLIVLSINLLGDWMRDALNPRLR
ncbi:MAG: ABC transporter permease [Acetobacteraceae bacterium]